MEKDCGSGIIEFKEFPHRILVRGNTITDLNIRIVSVDPGIRKLTHEYPDFFSSLEKHTDNSFS